MGHAAMHLALPAAARPQNLMVLFGSAKMASRQILADLVRVDVKSGRKLDVADVIAAEIDVHQPGNEFVFLGVPVKLHALHERGGAVANPNDRHADFAHRVMSLDVAGQVVFRAGWTLVEVAGARSRSHSPTRSHDVRRVCSVRTRARARCADRYAFRPTTYR